MKPFFLTTVLVTISLISFAQNSETSITVTVNNINNDNGNVLFSLNNKDTFMKGQGIMSAKSKIENGKAVVTFNNVKPGEYAIIALHDENDNNRMDFNANGMPKESYGTSNNVMAFGQPQYNNAKFEVGQKDINMEIKF